MARSHCTSGELLAFDNAVIEVLCEVCISHCTLVAGHGIVLSFVLAAALVPNTTVGVAGGVARVSDEAWGLDTKKKHGDEGVAKNRPWYQQSCRKYSLAIKECNVLRDIGGSRIPFVTCAYNLISLNIRRTNSSLRKNSRTWCPGFSAIYVN